MSTTLTIRDERPAGGLLHSIEIEIERERMTVAELITARVTAEVETYNRKLPGLFHGLVQPTESEKTLNGFAMKQGEQIDAEQQVYQALHAFQKKSFFILIDNRQVESLEEEIMVNPEMSVSFVKLIPLVGG